MIRFFLSVASTVGAIALVVLAIRSALCAMNDVEEDLIATSKIKPSGAISSPEQIN